MKPSFIFLADGFETIEALTPIDVLRRADIPVKTVSITSNHVVTSAQGIKVTADLIYDATLFTDPHGIILPGGMPGAQNLYDFAPLRGLLENMMKRSDSYIAAICASPAVVLGQMGLLEGRDATCYPGFEDKLAGANYVDQPVVADDKFVLGNGPANALRWSLAILQHIADQRTADGIAGDMLYFRNCDEVDNYFG